MGEIVNGKIEGECSPCEPLLFNLAINCKVVSAFVGEGENPRSER